MRGIAVVTFPGFADTLDVPLRRGFRPKVEPYPAMGMVAGVNNSGCRHVFRGSSLFGVGRNVLCGQLQIELSGEQVDHRLEVSD